MNEFKWMKFDIKKIPSGFRKFLIRIPNKYHYIEGKKCIRSDEFITTAVIKFEEKYFSKDNNETTNIITFINTHIEFDSIFPSNTTHEDITHFSLIPEVNDD